MEQGTTNAAKLIGGNISRPALIFGHSGLSLQNEPCGDYHLVALHPPKGKKR